MPNYRLDQYGGVEVIPAEADINVGLMVAPGTDAGPEYARTAMLPPGVVDLPQRPPDPVQPQFHPAFPGIPLEQLDAPLPITTRAWATLVKALGHMGQRIERLEQQLNLPPLPPT